MNFNKEGQSQVETMFLICEPCHAQPFRKVSIQLVILCDVHKVFSTQSYHFKKNTVQCFEMLQNNRQKEKCQQNIMTISPMDNRNI